MLSLDSYAGLVFGIVRPGLIWRPYLGLGLVNRHLAHLVFAAQPRCGRFRWSLSLSLSQKRWPIWHSINRCLVVLSDLLHAFARYSVPILEASSFIKQGELDGAHTSQTYTITVYIVKKKNVESSLSKRTCLRTLQAFSGLCLELRNLTRASPISKEKFGRLP